MATSRRRPMKRNMQHDSLRPGRSSGRRVAKLPPAPDDVNEGLHRPRARRAMMTDFRTASPTTSPSPRRSAWPTWPRPPRQGFKLVINNRPDGEEPGPADQRRDRGRGQGRRPGLCPHPGARRPDARAGRGSASAVVAERRRPGAGLLPLGHPLDRHLVARPGAVGRAQPRRAGRAWAPTPATTCRRCSAGPAAVRCATPRAAGAGSALAAGQRPAAPAMRQSIAARRPLQPF